MEFVLISDEIWKIYDTGSYKHENVLTEYNCLGELPPTTVLDEFYHSETYDRLLFPNKMVMRNIF